LFWICYSFQFGTILGTPAALQLHFLLMKQRSIDMVWRGVAVSPSSGAVGWGAALQAGMCGSESRWDNDLHCKY